MKVVRVSAIWCPGCLVMRPIWDKVLKQYPNISVIEYDYDIDEENIKNLNIGGVLPVAIITDDSDREIARIIGEKKYDEIIEVIDTYEKD